MDRSRSDRSIVADLLLGAAAGAVATWAMDRVTTVLYEREDERARRAEDAARGGEHAYERGVGKAAGLVGVRLDREQRERYGLAAHWALGVGMGALYGALRPRARWLSAGVGTLFGTLFFLVLDEGVNTALGFTPPPQEFPWQTHARGLAGHLTYGLVADTTLRAVERTV